MRTSFLYLISIISSIPKTIYFNFKFLPLYQAIRFPFYIHHGTEIHSGGKIELADGLYKQFFSIKFGNRGSDGVQTNGNCCFCLPCGIVRFEGPAAFGKGSTIRVSHSAKLVFGRNFCANRNTFISCSKEIIIGDDVLLGWNVSIRDSDGHTIILDGQPRLKRKPVIIGDHVWICAHAHVLKGTRIGSNSVIGYGAITTGGCGEDNVLWAGCPATIVRRNVNWTNEEFDF